MTDGYTERLAAALGDRYRIERRIGEGGMATVYLADDLRHERKVALKVLKPELAKEIGAERFVTEIKTTANLQHPNILPLHDSGEVGGFAFFVMPYVEGETLRERMEREGQLPIDDAISLVVDIADALHTAHEQGVVHRDVKPANILLSRGRPLVADFGIAKTVDRTEDTEFTRMEGGFIGTPRYMSPEQVTGDEEVDARSDIYALAAVLYALLAGKAPWEGGSMQSILARKLTQKPPGLTSVRPGVPFHVERAIEKALSVLPSDRQSTAKDFAVELRTPGSGLAVGALDATAVGADEGGGPPRVALGRRHRLVGRESEIDVLRGHLHRAIAGEGSFVLIGGEPGVGKTRLAEEILHEALEMGAMVVIGHCTEMDATSPYTPIAEQLDYASRYVGRETFSGVLGDSAAEIARVLPRLRQIFPDIPPAPELPPDVQRRNLIQHYREFVERAADVAPIVALYDDLHWSDEATLIMLENIAPHLAGLRVLYIGTYRDVELEVGRPWARTMGNLTRQRYADRILLRRMTVDQVTALLDELGGSTPPDSIVQAIYEGTEGNPFFIEEVFRDLADDGRLFAEDGSWRSDLTAEELDVPEGVRLVIGHRLERLSEETTSILAPAAIVGRRFDMRVLEELEVLESDALLDALDEAESAGLLRSDSNARRPSYGFTHELIRQTLLRRLSTPRRQRWHHRVAEAIKRSSPEGLPPPAGDIAYHLYEAGAIVEVDETRNYCILAGSQALDAAAFEQALAYIERAYSVDIVDPPAEQQLALERIRAAALWGTGIGTWPDAVATWLKALAIAESLEDGEAIVEICIVVNFGLLALDDHEKARETALKGLAVLGDAPLPARAWLLSKLGLATMYLDFESGADVLRQAEGLALELDDPLTLGRVYSDRSGHYLGWGHVREAIADGERATELIAPSQDPMSWIIAKSHIVSGVNVSRLTPELLDHSDELQQVSDRYGNLYGLTFAIRGQMDMCLYATGDWARYEDLCAVAAELHGVFPSAAGRGQIFLALCELNRREAVKAYEMAIDGAARTSDVGVWSDTWPGTLLWHAVRADAPDVDARADAVMAGLPSADGPIRVGWFDGVMASVEGLARMGRVDDAASLLPLMELITARGWRSGGGGLLSDTCAGIAAAAGDDWEAAESRFADADDFCGDRLVVFPARNSYWRAWTLLRRGADGDADTARALLQEARARFERLGMLLDVDDVDALMARADG